MKSPGEGGCGRGSSIRILDVTAKLSGDILSRSTRKPSGLNTSANLAQIGTPPSYSSDQLVPGEEVVDLKGRGIGRVGAMRDVVADAGAEVMANGAGCGVLRIRGPHGLAPFGDGAFRFQDHRENLAGAHEIRQLAKERPFAMNGTEAPGP